MTSLLYRFELPTIFEPVISSFLPKAILILTILTIVSQFIFDYKYRQAESIRRDAFIDDSFGCLLADTESKKYFSNDEISTGILKALCNVAENCFYSFDIVNQMLKKRLIITGFCGLALLTVIIFNIGGNQFIMLALNLVLSLKIGEDLHNLIYLKKSLEQINNRCKELLSSQREHRVQTPKNSFVGRIIRVIVQYESSLAYASIMLDSKYFNKINSEKEKQWEEFKMRFFSTVK